MATQEDYELTCLIESDPSTFPVTLPRTAIVDELRRAVYQRGQLPAFRIRYVEVDLWKVDIDIESFKHNLSEFRLEDDKGLRLISPVLCLSDLWPEQPPVQHLNVHARVVRSLVGESVFLPNPFQELHSASVSAARAALSPSTVANNFGMYKEEQNGHPIYNGRPVDLHGPPVEIYDETLAKLKDDLKDPSKAPEPSAEYIVQTADLFHAFATIYDPEPLPREAFLGPLRRLLGADLDFFVEIPEKNLNGWSTEMTIHGTLKDESCGKKTAVLVYLELKDELGVRSSGEGGLQATLSLRKFVSQNAYDEIRNVSCCPCIVISLAGPFLRISGAIFVEVFTVQTFTGYIYLGGNPFEMEQIKYVAKTFEAVARAVKSLRLYYYNLCVQKQPRFRPPLPTYPSNSPLRLPGSLVFKARIFFEQTADYHGSLFVAEYGHIPVLVKFCESYGEAAHRVLAAADLAPALRYCSQIVGGAFMVIMDLIDGPDAGQAFGHDDLPPTVLEDIHNAMKKLHEAGFVFGDMRRANIMLVNSRTYDEDKDEYGEDEWHGQLIDFNWSGPVGKARYPPTLNKDGRITWAIGVEPAGLIEKRHDEDMLGKVVIGIDSNE